MLSSKNVKKPKFQINTKAINRAHRDCMEKKAIDIKDPNLTYPEKLLLVLSQDKTKTENIKIIKKIDNSIKEASPNKDIKENDINVNIAKSIEVEEVKDSETSSQNIIKDEGYSNQYEIKDQNEKKEIVQESKKMTEKSLEKEQNLREKEQKCTNESINYLDDTNDTTINDSGLNQSSICSNNSDSNFNIIDRLKRFNEPRTQFYLENKLYDVLLNENLNVEFIPEKFQINDDHWTFVYPNDLKTYCLTESRKMLTKETKSIIPHNNNENNGLSFCGKNIEIKTEKGVDMKKCSANEFICKECMEKNKKMYNIQSKYLININGRVAKMHKGKYHCFGHFSVGNQIEDCISKFSCKACKNLDTLSNYYISNFMNH